MQLEETIYFYFFIMGGFKTFEIVWKACFLL